MSDFEEMVISETIYFVQKTLKEAEGGHDWFHIQRVWQNSKVIAKNEDVNLFITELGALLHDIADSKFHNGNEEIGPQISSDFLRKMNVPDEIVEHVEQIIRNISFGGGNESKKFNSKELMVVQDADRLDALGAIGIARAFNYGGYKGRAIYDPAVSPDLNMTKEAYKKSNAPTINHFYEKLLLLKDLMNTEAGKQMAEKRHQFMQLFLENFYQEWEGIEVVAV